MELSSTNVETVLRDCFFTPEELPAEDQEAFAKENGIIVEGILHTFAFHPARVAKHKTTIVAWIEQLPEQFDEGYSFLAMCNTKDGNQWTGLQKSMDELACLGMAVGVFASCMPRDMWPVLPGGVPYYQRRKQ